MAKPTVATDADVTEPVSALPGTAWRYLFARALREFGRDQCQDLAAALTYRAVFAIFPGLLAMFSVLGLVGQGRAGTTTADWLLHVVQKYGSQELATLLGSPIKQLTTGGGAGLFLAVGILGAIWTTSGYVLAFGRALNQVFDVEEGRSFLVLRVNMYLLTVGLLIGALASISLLVISGSVARTLGDLVGLGEETLDIWNVAKWPVLVVLVVLMIASLYYFTPNVRRDRFPWLSPGAAVALAVLALATAGFAVYLANFAHYNKTYGVIGGLVALLLWIWIANAVLLFGAEIDAETERAKQLQSGLKAERELQLPPRSTKTSRKRAKQLEEDVRTGRQLRALAKPITPEDVPRHRLWPWLLGSTALGTWLVARRRRERS